MAGQSLRCVCLAMIGLLVLSGCGGAAGDGFWEVSGTASAAEPAKDRGSPADGGGRQASAKDEAPAAAAGGEENPAGGQRPPGPFEDWTDPAAVLVFSGEQHAYLEPCGCTENQSGGLARRFELFRQIQQRGWPAFALDVGGALNPERMIREQAKYKLEFFRKALNAMHYSGLVLGREELKLGGDRLFELHSQWSSEDGFDLPFVSANVTILSSREIGTLLEYRVVDVGGRRIGFTGVIGATRARDVEVVDEFILKIDDARAVLPGVLAKLKAERCDLLILGAHADAEEAEAFAREFPDFQIVVSAGGPEDPQRSEQWIGKTLFVQVGRKGKNVAAVGFFPDHADRPLRYELIELDRHRFPTAPEMVQLMREYQQALIENKPDFTFEIAPPNENGFVGAEKCLSCHEGPAQVWSDSGHAHALESLQYGRHEESPEHVVDRRFDPECLACHVVGWEPQKAIRFRGGYVDMETTPHLANQQCENCHGAGGKHVELELAARKSGRSPEQKEARKTVRVTLEQAREKFSCEQCHDHDNSPTFEFDSYWEQVAH